MKKKIIIIFTLFIASTVLYSVLKYTINTQLLSRIIYGMDYNSYLNSSFAGIGGFLNIISGVKMPYEWLFTLSNYIFILIAIIITYIATVKLGKKYKLNSKEFIIVMILFSILSLYESIYILIAYKQLVPIELLKVPILYIVTAFIGIYRNIYRKSIDTKK